MDVPVESKLNPTQFNLILKIEALTYIVSKTNRTPEDVVRRLDSVIADIRDKFHRRSFEDPKSNPNGDVLIVAHGHILRAFAMRWTGKPLSDTSLILEAGGVGTLR